MPGRRGHLWWGVLTGAATAGSFSGVTTSRPSRCPMARAPFSNFGHFRGWGRLESSKNLEVASIPNTIIAPGPIQSRSTRVVDDVTVHETVCRRAPS